MSFLDLFCASYEATSGETETDRETMDRLDVHRDGSLLSFTVLLSQPEDFEGGGTNFDALRDAVDESDQQSILKASGSIQPLTAGYATLHSGKLLHGGHVVTKGQRIVLVGFIDVDLRNMREGVLGNAAKEWGRNDVCEFWNRRLKMKEQASWKINNWRYLPKKGRSCLGQCTLPASLLKSIENRSKLDRIRERRLRTEDRLLRDIMLPRTERGEKIEDDFGELIEVSPEEMDGLMIGWEDTGAAWGRNDVCEFWNRRLKMKEQASWKINNWRYLPKKGRSCLGQCTLPASLLKSIENRSKLDRIRERRLRTEDRLLRDIMLPRTERGEKIEDDFGELIEVSPEEMDGLMIGWEDTE